MIITTLVWGGADIIQYVGIAADEKIRLARLKPNQISLLDKYGYTESMAKDLCKHYNLLSPIYATGTRNGCWFCPSARISFYARFRREHPELWQELRELDKEENRTSKSFKYGLTLAEVEARMDAIDNQLTLF